MKSDYSIRFTSAHIRSLLILLQINKMIKYEYTVSKHCGALSSQINMHRANKT